MDNAIRRGPVDDMWRVDVQGIPIMVQSEYARRLLEQNNQRLARMKLALHRVGAMHPNDHDLGAIVREGLS